MFPALSPFARFTAALIALAAIGSIIARFIYEQQTGGGTAGEAIWTMARFFTILTNAFVFLTFGTAALRREGVGAPWIAALTLAIVLVGAVYHTLLRGLVTFEGIGIWADIGFHTVVPIACFLWWLSFGPKRGRGYGDLPMFVMWPAAYIAYALARGHYDGRYPYPFMNLNELSTGAVATNLLGLFIVLLIGGVIFVMIARFADR